MGRNNAHGVDRISGRASIGEVLFVKHHDESTIDLMTHMMKTKSIPLVKIDFVTTDNPPQAYKTVKLYNVLISSFSEHAGLEHLTLNFTKFETTYSKRSASGKLESPKTMGYDITTSAIV